MTKFISSEEVIKLPLKPNTRHWRAFHPHEYIRNHSNNEN